MDIPLRDVARACAGMLFVLLAHITFVQAFSSRDLNADARNERGRIARFDRPRGAVFTFDGTTVAESRETGGGPYRYRRFYPQGEMYAPITGHVSPRQATGIERAQEAELSGHDAKVKMQSLVREGVERGADIRLTVSEHVQWAAYQSLKSAGRPGAAVAIDPSTGAVLALASYPSYDPNVYTTFDTAEQAAADRRLRGDPARPLRNRALDETYPAGSAFTLVTAAASLGHGLLSDQADAFGFNATDLTIPLPVTASTYRASPLPTGMDPASPPAPGTHRASPLPTGMDPASPPPAGTHRASPPSAGASPVSPLPAGAHPASPAGPGAVPAAGHPDGRLTPLMAAMLSAAVANRGTLMRPYLVEEVRLPDGSVIDRAGPAPYRAALSPGLAARLTTMMVTRPHGVGTAVTIPGVKLAAAGDPAVFTAFAPARAPEVAVAVILERPGPTALIARAIIQAALS